MNYFKSLKDGKRRAVESVLEATGQSEKTVDENFEIDLAQFTELVEGITHSKSAIKSLLESQQAHYEYLTKHAGFLHKLYENNNNPKSEGYTVLWLESCDQCEQYVKSADRAHNSYR